VDFQLLPPGTRFADHAVECPRTAVVICGRLRIVLNGTERVLGPGDAAELAPGCRCSLEVLGEEPVVSLDASREAELSEDA
jgi:quercetin dioxygenase-like cupin family protein